MANEGLVAVLLALAEHRLSSSGKTPSPPKEDCNRRHCPSSTVQTLTQ